MSTHASLRQHGFSLVELLVAMTILAILMAIAIPSYNSLVLSGTASRYASSMAESALLARGEAIRRNAAITMCVSTDGTTCGSGSGGWEQGWLVSCKTNDLVTCDTAGASTLVIQYQGAAKSGWKITEASGLARIDFDPSGTGATAASMTVCRATPTVGEQQRTVRLGATGRPTVVKTSSATCS
jgi:type IV fimbrial biogenesis protein FimT